MSIFRKKKIAGMNKEAGHDEEGHSLERVLTVKDLTFLGIAAVVGAGIFSTIGSAASNGGPGISLLFIITAITCGFSALCYAEFASRVPISGSAYTYAYVSFGELAAWIIGWALILEYAIGNIVVAISWSSYLNNLLLGVGIEIPFWMTTNAEDARKAYESAQQLVLQNDGGNLAGAQKIIAGFKNAPVILGKSLFMNIPAFVIVGLITIVAFIGIKESKKSANFMVIFKVAVIILVIIIGFFYVNPDNWTPFLPNGFTGVLAGVSAVFYAYIGFDAISTTAEECKNPQRDLPRGMIYALLICTVLYILIALVLTGMVNYTELNVPDPLAFVFDRLNLNWIGYIISLSAVIATTSVMLVFQLGQPRIWMSMSRDGLLPKAFGRVHKKYHTPAFATIVTGVLVAVPSLFLPGSLVTDLTSIGTLFAFVLVCAGVLTLPRIKGESGKFHLPYLNGQVVIPVLTAVFIFLSKNRIQEAFIHLGNEGYQELLFLLFIMISIIVALFSAARKFSVIPVLGSMSCLYLMIEIPPVSWFWFFVWMAAGLMVYFSYGYRRSKLTGNEQAFH